eukprot:17717_4
MRLCCCWPSNCRTWLLVSSLPSSPAAMRIMACLSEALIEVSKSRQRIWLGGAIDDRALCAEPCSLS